MMRRFQLQVSKRAAESAAPLLHVGGMLLCSALFTPLAMAQPGGVAATLDKVNVVSSETHEFPLNTSADKKIIYVPPQSEGRTVSGEIVCDMQTQAVLNNWYPFRYYLYKQVGGQLNLIKGGGLSTNKQTYSYTATKADETGNTKYLFSAHLNHAQVTGQCSLTVKITEVVNVAPQQMRNLPALDKQKLKRTPRPPGE